MIKNKDANYFVRKKKATQNLITLRKDEIRNVIRKKIPNWIKGMKS